MKQNSDEENGIKLRRWILSIVGAALLIGINSVCFYRKVSSNHALASHYTLKEDPMDRYRNPAVAGIFYSMDISGATKDVYQKAGYRGNDMRPRIVIIPRDDGDQSSAAVSEQAYRLLSEQIDKIKTIILLEPSEQISRKGALLPNAEYIKTPLGQVSINRGFVKELLKNTMFSSSSKVDIRKQLPFLQKLPEHFSIVPIIYGDVEPDNLAEALAKYLTRSDVLLVVKADLSHYGISDTAIGTDEDRRDDASGIETVLRLSRQLHLKPEMSALINYGDNDDINVIGYGSFGRKGRNVPALKREYEGLRSFVGEYGEQILTAARRSLQQAIRGETYRPSRKEYDEHLFDRGAVFVTLHRNGEIYGSAGSLYPRQAVVADVAANTAAALGYDKADSAMAGEQKNIRISVALLTGYEKIDYRDEEDLLQQLQSGTDGVVIRDGNRQGLFLPSEWEHAPDKRTFLSNLKLKAGMSPSFWSNDIKVYRFRTVEVKEDGY